MVFRLLAVAIKQYFREVVVDVEIIVVKRIILLRVEHFEKCRCRVALEVVAYFIDFIENEYLDGGSRFLYAMNDSSRHGFRYKYGDALVFRPRRADRLMKHVRICGLVRRRSICPKRFFPHPEDRTGR